MPGQKRNKALRASQRERIAEMRLQSIPVSQIAKALRISDSTVNRELASLATEWRNQARATVETHRDRELKRLELIERKAWAEYERSQRDYSKEVTERLKMPGKGEDGGDFTTDPQTIKRETGGRLGDPKYLQVALNAHERRCKILGLDAPTKVAPTDPSGEKPFEMAKMSDAELNARIAELTQKLGAAATPGT